MMDTFSTDITTARVIHEFMGEQNKYRGCSIRHKHKGCSKLMTKGEAIRRLIMNGHEWWRNEKILWSVTPEEYKEHTEKRREEYKQSVLQ